ncbi:MAG: IS21 family transposase [Planctomycetota bacterium]
MPAKRLSMRKILDILTLVWGQGLSQSQASVSLDIARSTVGDCVRRAEEAGLKWPLDPATNEAALEALLYASPATPSRPRAVPDCKYLHKELHRKGVTLQLLWEEYKAVHPEDGYQYTQFCEYYRRFEKTLQVVMRQEHRAGEKLFVDYSGDGLFVTDRQTGKRTPAHLFVAVLGASSYIYAEATPSQDLHSWIHAQVHAFDFIQGVPRATVPDNTKTGVTHPCYYEPEINPTYHEFARHYNTVILPTRPRKPRDKAKVEVSVLMAQRMIVAALRNHTFFSFEDLNGAIRALVERINNRKFKKLDTTRRELFETVDRPALQPLPVRPYEFAEWFRPKVNIDYHVEVRNHYYSAAHQLLHKQLDARLTSTTLELFYRGQRVASHVRDDRPGKHSTLPEHMPKAHRAHLEWTPSRILRWAAKTGPKTAQLVKTIMETRPHPEQGYRACLGLLRLGTEHGNDRLEAACTRALAIRACSYRSVASILKRGLDRVPLNSPEQPRPPINHENVRGRDQYQ